MLSDPRMRTCVNAPTPPLRLTARPGTSRSTSDTTRVWRSSSAASSITVSEAGTSAAFSASPEREAVTITSSFGSLVWANAGAASASDNNGTYLNIGLLRHRERLGGEALLAGATSEPDTRGRDDAPACPRKVRRSQRRTVPRSHLDRSRSDQSAGRSPGSRVVTRCTPSRTDKSASGRPHHGAGASRSPLTVAGTAADLASYPAAPHSLLCPCGHRRDLRTG